MAKTKQSLATDPIQFADAVKCINTKRESVRDPISTSIGNATLQPSPW